jgi:hypothetical protein
MDQQKTIVPLGNDKTSANAYSDVGWVNNHVLLPMVFVLVVINVII